MTYSFSFPTWLPLVLIGIGFAIFAIALLGLVWFIVLHYLQGRELMRLRKTCYQLEQEKLQDNSQGGGIKNV